MNIGDKVRVIVENEDGNAVYEKDMMITSIEHFLNSKNEIVETYSVNETNDFADNPDYLTWKKVVGKVEIEKKFEEI